MIIYPSIDLLDGKCVRLMQGKYDRVTEYSEDPVAVARGFREQGATWVHIVDLNAARTGRPKNQSIIRRIASETGLAIQTGGGIRNLRTLYKLLSVYDVTRCVLGTSAIRDREFTEEALRRFPDNVAIGIDARDGEVAADGWTSGSGLKSVEFARTMQELGARTIIFTDIARDGMMTGPSTEQTAELVAATKLSVIASGGIGSEDDIDEIRKSGCSGVIVGKAIYEGKVRLAECLQKELSLASMSKTDESSKA
ncbi:MAG: 1-(5-phosphoribosyl)-5-[(5-phosphoribosylamino)methylideneamino]imidazole-4-carboxamide isomerase [Clostridiales bacterium]|nr:1-(5-phosphoribosyl)-5-[(5-phosphoribosylamino)methylideneamino]imidazole-4-carboxamide isomerase [Clostridiales bacterium]